MSVISNKLHARCCVITGLRPHVYKLVS